MKLYTAYTFKIIDQSPTFPQKWNYNMIKEFLPYKIKRLVCWDVADANEAQHYLIFCLLGI